jgi:hypothetical protein
MFNSSFFDVINAQETLDKLSEKELAIMNKKVDPKICKRYVCICIYIYICIYTYVYIYVCIYIYIYVYIYIYIHRIKCVEICIVEFGILSMVKSMFAKNIQKNVLPQQCDSTILKVCMCLCVDVCVFVFVCVFGYLCICIYIYVYIYICVHRNINIYIYI